MDKKTLVEADFEEGGELMLALAQAGLPLHAAFWAYDDERACWRLYIASPLVAAEGSRKAHFLLYETLDRLYEQRPPARRRRFTGLQSEHISMLAPDDYRIKVRLNGFNNGRKKTAPKKAPSTFDLTDIGSALIYQLS